MIYRTTFFLFSSIFFVACNTENNTIQENNYKLHEKISSTIFWIGEEASSENGDISNIPSAWDENWTLHYGGVDSPNMRQGYYPQGFIPKENPFYFALPYNDIDNKGEPKKERSTLISWASPLDSPTQSICKNRWIKITKDNATAYAQWEDVGPFHTDDSSYVFGNSIPQSSINNHAGLDLSPALQTYLKIKDIDSVTWSFVDDKNVADGPWREHITISNLDWNKAWYKPSKTTSWQWQLTGQVDIHYTVNLYDIDLFESSKELIEQLHKEGKKVICYFSAGSYEDFREDAALFDTTVLGNNLDKWEGEKWLDISNPSVVSIMLQRLDLAKVKGCDGVEPDNVDGYTNDTGFLLTATQQFHYNKRIADEAHLRGLSVGLKNDIEQIRELEPFFDFSIIEECYEYNECKILSPFLEANKPVFNAEYNIDEKEREDLCIVTNALEIQTLILPLNLDNSFRYSCDDYK